MSHPQLDGSTSAKREFAEIFGSPCAVLVRAPGRVNLIGEHTDYNDGLVMPAAIGFATRAAAAASERNGIAVRSAYFSESVELSFDEIDSGSPRNHWSDYVCGVAFALRQAGYVFPGANLLIRGDVPVGSGMSSSAAIEVATAFALLQLAGVRLSRLEIAQLCQRAENEVVGARCGIMDQFASCHGKRGHAILLDCRSLESRYIRLPEGVSLVVSNTMVRHSVAAGEYNIRRKQCEQGVHRIQKFFPDIASLRDLTPEQLEHCGPSLDPVIYRRCKHVVEENRRVSAAAAALMENRLAEFGDLMNASHASLRDLFEVSCKELDEMTGIASECPGVLGSRMMGGGFGGCVISLVENSSTGLFVDRMKEQYRNAAGDKCEIYICSAEDGAGEEIP